MSVFMRGYTKRLQIKSRVALTQGYEREWKIPLYVNNLEQLVKIRQ